MNKIQYHQVEKPKQIETDSRGTQIQIGSQVAYNRAGKILLGTIYRYVRCTWKVVRPGQDNKSWWALYFNMQIKGEDDAITTLKNPNSFVIIKNN